MIKIAIIIDNITRSAGTERATCNLANIFAQNQRYQTVIISMYSEYGSPYFCVHDNIKILHCSICEKRKILRRINEYKKVRALHKKENFDILIGTNPAFSSLLPVIAGTKKKITIEHLSYGSISLFPRIIRRLTYSFLDAVVLLTNTDAAQYNFLKNKVVIPNSLSFLPKEYSSLTDKTILAVGRLCYQKGFERLIEAISLIKDKCPDWQVRIIGDGEDKDNLTKRIKYFGMENIIKIIPPTDKIEDEYCNASVYVMSSRYEGLPMALIEAKSCGLPIVSFNCPEGPADIIRDGIDGFLVEENNIVSLSKSILKLIEDEDLRKQFGKEAINDINRFKPEHVGLLWDKLFNDLLKTE